MSRMTVPELVLPQRIPTTTPTARSREDDDEPDDIVANAREALGPDLSDIESNGRQPSRTWAGDPALLEDLGISAAELVQLTTQESDDPAAVLAGIGEACGFDEQLDALR